MTEPIDVTNITQGEIHKLLQQANRAKGLNSVESVPGKVFLQVKIFIFKIKNIFFFFRCN